jgi:putative ABC transport system substrate-binding protein
MASFLQALRELGYVEGQNITIQQRSAEGNTERLPPLAAELVAAPVDVIVAVGPLATQAVKEASATIPIVFPISSDPVAEGLVASLARPGGNATGLANLQQELVGKRLELLKEIAPGASRVAVLWTAPSQIGQWGEVQHAAHALGVQTQSLPVQDARDFDGAFEAAAREHADALMVLGDPLSQSHRTRLAELAAQTQLPTVYTTREYVVAGGLMSYGPSFTELWRRTAAYVDKILRGARPADLPVERPMRFDFAVNMKTARELGITFPNEILLQITEVIDQ